MNLDVTPEYGFQLPPKHRVWRYRISRNLRIFAMSAQAEHFSTLKYVHPWAR
ncbi:MAG TPA: hypothetical protein VH196_01750 [Terriglobales bacterium]|nr:hypothetical protein [Terriglobales bacterium]